MQPEDAGKANSELLVSNYIDGFQFPVHFPVEAFHSALQYKPRPNDVFIVTYPKCGTTWAQEILLLLFREGEPLLSPIEFFRATPFLDTIGAKSAEDMPRPNAIKTHLPFHLIPWSEQAKYIYIARNPKDCCVSYFHHMTNIPPYGFKGDFDQYFEFFLSGKIDYEDYFDHLIGWYEHRNDPNVLFLTYEEMKENTETSILKMASFIDEKKYAQPLRKDQNILNNILKYSSFQCMKESATKRMEEMISMPREEILNSNLPHLAKIRLMREREEAEIKKKQGNPRLFRNVRKGVIGDWRSYFSDDQNRRMNEKFAERTKGTEIEGLWKNYM
ncbi:sulfotransferase 1C4 [Trichonephila clavata]|uniref:Sulfotransferase 1C4 n=1 Tax=Trichonephila clavata TaxID=2740835 RepID=A0A8X6HSQ4_TRICU|nr:sulfotransferase 1C4 [Trichonephila clavata]